MRGFRIPTKKKARKIGTVGYIIYRLREEMNITIRTLAEMSSVHFQCIGRIEEDKIKPSLETLVKIANALGCDVIDLLANANNTW